MFLLSILFSCSSSGDHAGSDDRNCDLEDENQDLCFLGIGVNTENHQPHHVIFTVELNASAPLGLSCTLDSDSREVHQISSAQAVQHELHLHGLLADEDYTCSLISLDLSEEFLVRTAEQGERIPETVVAEHDESRRTGAYTLVSHLEKTADPNFLKLLILDPEGRVRWFHFMSPGHSGDLDSQYLGNGRIFFGAAQGIRPTIVTLSGMTEWRGTGPSTEGSPHHHVEYLDDGDVLMLSTLPNTDEFGDFTGFAVEKVHLYEDTVRWTFDSQVAVDAGQLGRLDDLGDPWHPNGLVLVEDDDGEGVLVSLYQNRQIVRVDPESNEVLWQMGEYGDFTLLDSAGEPLDSSNWFRSPHAPELNGDRLLLYDNGTPSDGSRIVELELDQANRIARETWSWKEEGWHQPIWGDVDDLGNGHLLITRGHCQGCGGVDPDSRSEIVEVDRETGEVVWRVSFPHADDGLYRSERIDGCALFENARYCE